MQNKAGKSGLLLDLASAGFPEQSNFHLKPSLTSQGSEFLLK